MSAGLGYRLNQERTQLIGDETQFAAFEGAQVGG